MRRNLGPWLAAALLLTAASASAGAVSDFDRFQLWNECRAMRLVVESLPNDATAIGLTEDSIEVAVRSRLRAARLYTDDYAEVARSSLYAKVNVLGPAFNTALEYWKAVRDLATGLEYQATAWEVGSTGTHGQDSNYILSTVAKYTDKFIDEYLRVNADACK